MYSDHSHHRKRFDTCIWAIFKNWQLGKIWISGGYMLPYNKPFLKLFSRMFRAFMGQQILYWFKTNTVVFCVQGLYLMWKMTIFHFEKPDILNIGSFAPLYFLNHTRYRGKTMFSWKKISYPTDVNIRGINIPFLCFPNWGLKRPLCML